MPQSCTGFELTDAKLEYPEGTAACNGNSAESAVSQAVQMGVICASTEESAIGPAGTEFTYYGDLVFDCTDLNALYNDLDEYGVGFAGDNIFANTGTLQRYTCYKSTQFAAGSTPDAVQPIPAVGISTDTLWLTSPAETCFTIMPNPDYTAQYIEPLTVVPTPGATTARPTNVPPGLAGPKTTSVEPTAAPTTDAISSPQLAISLPTQAPIAAAPSSAAVLPTNSIDRDGNGSSRSRIGSSNSLAFGAGVVVALAVVAAFFVCKRKSDNPNHRGRSNSTMSFAGIAVRAGGASLDQDPSSRQYRRHGDLTEEFETEAGDMHVVGPAVTNTTPALNQRAAKATVPPQPPLAMRVSASGIEYKDQVRSVAAVPIARAIPDRDVDRNGEPPMLAPVMGPAVTLENSVVSAKPKAP